LRGRLEPENTRSHLLFRYNEKAGESRKVMKIGKRNIRGTIREEMSDRRKGGHIKNTAEIGTDQPVSFIEPVTPESENRKRSRG